MDSKAQVRGRVEQAPSPKEGQGHTRGTRNFTFVLLPSSCHFQAAAVYSCALNINTQNTPHLSVGLFWHFICNDKHCSKAGPITSRDRCTEVAASMKPLNGKVSKKTQGHPLGGLGQLGPNVFSVTHTVPAGQCVQPGRKGASTN